MENLVLAKSKKSIIPFIFQYNKLKVYTFEEAVFYASKEVLFMGTELFDENFYFWLDKIGLKTIAKAIKDYYKKNNFENSFCQLMSITDIFSKDEIEKIRSDIFLFYEKNNIDRYIFMAKKYEDINPNFAINYYLKVVNYTDDFDVLYSLGNLYKSINNFSSAIALFEKADLLYDNILIKKNLFECYIKVFDKEKAEIIFSKIENSLDVPDRLFFKGELCLLQKNYSSQISYYLDAYKIREDKVYFYKIIDTFINRRMYKEAEDFINNSNLQDVDTIIRLAEVYKLSGNTKKAIVYLEKYLPIYNDNITMLVALSSYKRQIYDRTFAKVYLNKALQIDNTNKNVLLEKARTLKNDGFIKEYAKQIDYILTDIRDTYRCNHL